MSPKRKGDEAPPITRVAVVGELLQVLLSQPSPLQRVIAFSAVVRAGTANPGSPHPSPQQILSHLLTTPLDEVVSNIEAVYTGRPDRPGITASLDQFCRDLARPLREVAKANPTLLQAHPALLDQIVGETRLGDYYGSDQARRGPWVPLLEEAGLVRRAQNGDREAFGTLWGGFKREVSGLIRGRIRDYDDSQDVAQDTSIDVLEHLSAYDPALADFKTFAKYRAWLKIHQYWSDRGDRRRVEITFSEIIARFPGFEQVPDIDSLLAGLAPEHSQSPSPEDDKVKEETEKEEKEERERRLQVFDDLLSLMLEGSLPPHQAMVVDLLKLVETPKAGGKKKQREWEPQTIVERLADTPLRNLAERFERGYPRQNDRTRASFRRFKEKMGRRFEEAVTDPTTKSAYRHLVGRIIGETTLRDYFTGNSVKDYRQDISQWMSNVKRYLAAKAEKQGQGPLFDRLREGSKKRPARKTRPPRKKGGGPGNG